MNTPEQNAAIVDRLPTPSIVKRRTEALKCCAHVHPTGTHKHRYCRNEALVVDLRGYAFCETHQDRGDWDRLTEHLAAMIDAA